MDPTQNNQPQVPTPPDPAQQNNSGAAPIQPPQQAAAPVPAVEPTAMPPVINSTAPQPTPLEVPSPQTIQPVDQFTPQQPTVPPQPPILSAEQPAATPITQPLQANTSPQPPITIQATPGYSNPASDKKFPIKLVAIIFGAIVTIALVLFGALAAYTMLFSTIPLKTYQGDGFSVLVPKDYEKEGTDSNLLFKEPDAPEKEQSSQIVSKIDVASFISSGVSKDDLIKEMDKSLSEDTIIDAYNSISDTSKLEDYNLDETTYQGFEARTVTAKIVDDTKKAGSVRMLIVYGDKAFYMLGVGAHTSDPSFERAFDKIFTSLKIE